MFDIFQRVFEGIDGGWFLLLTMDLIINWKIPSYVMELGGKNGTIAPSQWIMVEEIESGKETGYNSDPTMIYHNKNLYIYWRENFTERTTAAGNIRATYCKVFTEEDSKDVDEPILTEQSIFCDREMFPTFFIGNGNFYCYGVDYRFIVEKWQHS